MDQAGIHTVMQSKADDSRQQWTLSAFLKDGFTEYVRNTRFLFQEEFDVIGIKTTGGMDQRGGVGSRSVA
jgi:hypothetical protein